MKTEEKTLNDLNWHHFLTPEEVKLIGSTSEARYLEKPRVPRIVQDGMDISLADNIRQYFGGYGAIQTKFTYKDGGGEIKEDRLIAVKLSPLDLLTGEAIEDPQPADEGIIFNPRYMPFNKERG